MSLDIRDLDRLTARLAGDYAALARLVPARPRTVVEGDILDFSFLDGLDREEDHLRHARRTDELRKRREEALEPFGRAMADSVADTIRLPVHFHVELFDPAAARTTFLFGLDSRLRNLAALDFPDLPERSRELREEASRLREESVDARQTAALIRARLSRWPDQRG